MAASSPRPSYDAVLALLKEMASDEDYLSLTFSSDEGSIESPAVFPESPRDQSLTRANKMESADRFKRARERKKNEFAFLRKHAHELEQTLANLQEKRRIRTANTNSITRVWRGAALRQREARQQAEAVNAQLKRMVEATLRHTQRLQALLEFPEGVDSLTYRKIVRKYDGDNRLRDSVTFHNLLIAQELLFFDVPPILERFVRIDSTESASVPPRSSDLGCGIHIEAMDSRALPYDIHRASASAWRFFTTDSKTDVSSASVEMNGDSVARIFSLDVVHNVLCTTYMARCLYRRRIDSRGRVVIAWTCALVPHGLWNQEPHAVTHETFDRVGFVVLSPLHSDPSRVTIAQSYYRVKREACTEIMCNAGGCGIPTARTLERSMRLCAKSEIKRWLEGIEGGLTLQDSTQGALLLQHAQSHESPLLPCFA